LKYFASLILSLAAFNVWGHEFGPAQVELKPSIYNAEILETDVRLYNRRDDALWFEFKVYDKDFKPVPFNADSKIVRQETDSGKNYKIRIKRRDFERATYVCTISKILISLGPKTKTTICLAIKK